MDVYVIRGKRHKERQFLLDASALIKFLTTITYALL